MLICPQTAPSDQLRTCNPHLTGGKVAATPQSIARLQAAINTLEKEKQETAETLSRARQAIQKNKIDLRKFAAQAELDPANLYNAFTGKRRLSPVTFAKLQSALIKIDD